MSAGLTPSLTLPRLRVREWVGACGRGFRSRHLVTGIGPLSRPGLIVPVLLLLAGCATGGGWIKPGAEEGAAAREYRDCRALADSATRTEVDIDQDIAATRQTDWRRSGLGQVMSQRLREETRDRAAAIVASCMQAKGFAPAR